MGELVAIWLKRNRRGPMDRVSQAAAVAGRGLAGNANQGGSRQVTIIDETVWNEVIDSLGAKIDPSARRANLMLRGIDLRNGRGRVIRIGSIRVRIKGETKPCEQMEAKLPGLKNALYADWRGGAFGEILDDGEIWIGDAVEWLELKDSSQQFFLRVRP